MVASLAAPLVIRDGIERDVFAVTRVLAGTAAESPWGRCQADSRLAQERAVLAFAGEVFARGLASGIVRVALAGGEVVGAAVWALHPAADRPAAVSGAVDGSGGGKTSGMPLRDQLCRLAGARRPPAVVHQELVLIGVRRGCRHQGIASYLLISHHAFLHALGVPALLVADHVSRGFFERHGYSGVGPPGLLPGGMPAQVMWRDPGPG